ncbi:MAG: glycosyltransferase family 39 protein, partial [Chloroflexota bacterium]
KGGLAPLYYWLTAWPIALVGEESLPDIRRVDSRPERHIPTDGLGINHVLHTLDEQWPWRGQILAWHWVRFFSLPMGWITIIATYILARTLFPRQESIAFGAALFIAFLPRFVISSAVINDDNLVFALTALLLLVQIIILQGNHRQAMFGLLGALLGLSLITKYFSLILIPEIILTLFFTRKTVSTAPLSPKSNNVYQLLRLPLIAFLGALFITAGPWFIFIVIQFNQVETLGLIPGLAASLGEPQITEGLVGLLSGQSVRPPAATYSLSDWSGLLYRSFWYEYGWMRVFAPTWVYLLFSLLLVGGLFGLTQKIRGYQVSTKKQVLSTRLTKPILILLLLHVSLFVVVVLVRYILSATIDTGQGRHLYSALPVIAIFIAAGLSHLSNRVETGKNHQLKSGAYRFISPVLLALYVIISTFVLLSPQFIAQHYHTLPITSHPDRFSISSPQNISLTDEIALIGLNAGLVAKAGETLPVTLFWQANSEVNQDYLGSLCLKDEEALPVACWRGHFVDGAYPTRAWEIGDTIADTVFIPIPTCTSLPEKTYTMQLTVWPLNPNAPYPDITNPPVIDYTFTEFPIIIEAAATDNVSAELWRRNERLADTVDIHLNESLTQISYSSQTKSKQFQGLLSQTPWHPLSDLTTNLHLPCQNSSTPFAQVSHYIADPTLPFDTYQSESFAHLNLSFSPRTRTVSPIDSPLTFDQTLSPLTLQLLDKSPIPFQTNQVASQFDLGADPISNLQSSHLPVSITWHAHQWMADPLVVSLKLLDKDFNVAGERVATLGDRYPNVLWIPTETIEETYPVQINPDAPSGLYQLEVGLIRQDNTLPDGFEHLPILDGETQLSQNLYPLTVRLLDPDHQTSPPISLIAEIGETIKLTGYGLSQQNDTIDLALYWQAVGKISTSYTVFTQLIGPDGQVWAQWDNPPQAGRYPMINWSTNDKVVDRYQLTLREGAPSGNYQLLIGLYDPATGQRLPPTINGEAQPHDAIQLTTLTLTPK